MQNNREEAIVKKICSDVPVYNLTDFLTRKWRYLGNDRLSHWDEKYDIPSVWRLYYTDRFLTKYKYDESRRFINGHFRFFEKVFNEQQPAYFVYEPVSSFSSYVAYYIGKRNNFSYLGMMIGRTDSLTHFYFTHDPAQRNIEMDEIIRYSEYSANYIEKAKQYIKAFREKPKRPAAIKAAKQDLLIKSRHVKMPIMMLRTLCNKENWNKCNYEQYRYDRYILYRSLFPIRAMLARKYFVILMQKINMCYSHCIINQKPQRLCVHQNMKSNYML